MSSRYVFSGVCNCGLPRGHLRWIRHATPDWWLEDPAPLLEEIDE